jgi:hypothetical protein
LIVRRRFVAFCVGAGKTGTTSIAAMFSNYRAAHEAASDETITQVLAGAGGRTGDRELVEFFAKRDRRLWLELESSQILGSAIGSLAAAVPEAKYILTVREPRSWMRSTVHHLQTQSVRPEWRDYADLRFGTKGGSNDGDTSPRLCGYSIDGYLSYWARHNRAVLDTIPEARLLVVPTDQISASLGAIAAFVGVPVATLDPSAAHARRSPAYTDPLARIDPDFIDARIEHWCGDLLGELFAGR